ncbi:hypothetical protein OAL04_01285 [Nitrospinae bacterium]|nr:hypothetical protein [Nitrospinota bacterium]
MEFRKLGWLTLSVFFLVFLGTLDSVESKNTPKKIQQPAIKEAKIKGFRSARFGMNERDVLKAIAKDFKISKSKVKRTVHSLEKTKMFTIIVPNLIGLGATAKIVYLMGYKSKKLMQVNVVWGKGADKPEKKFDAKRVIDAANFLRNHFVKKKFVKDGYLANARLNKTTTIVFRGLDKKGRMAVLSLMVPPTEKGEELETARQKITLKLSYMLDPTNVDIFTVKENDF